MRFDRRRPHEHLYQRRAPSSTAVPETDLPFAEGEQQQQAHLLIAAAVSRLRLEDMRNIRQRPPGSYGLLYLTANVNEEGAEVEARLGIAPKESLPWSSAYTRDQLVETCEREEAQLLLFPNAGAFVVYLTTEKYRYITVATAGPMTRMGSA